MAKRRIARQHGIRPERSHANLLAYSQLRAESQTSIKETTYCYTGTGPSPSSSPATAGEEGEGPSGLDLESSGKIRRVREERRWGKTQFIYICLLDRNTSYLIYIMHEHYKYMKIILK
jgi:hypothetical protein